MKSFLTVTFSLLSTLAFSQVEWEKLFSNISTDAFRSVQEVPAGGYVAAGYLADSTVNDSDAYVVRLDLLGDTIWTFRYNGPMSKKDLLYKIICTSDGGFAACGYSTSFTGTSDDVFYLKLDASGNLQWVKSLGGSGKDRAQDIIETSNGYTLAGYSTSAPAQYYDAYLIHTDLNGDVLWTKIHGNTNYDDANVVRQLPDGGYIMGGQSTNGANGLDQFLIRTDSAGDTLWTRRFGTAMTDNIESLIVRGDGFILAGSTNSPTTGDDGYIVKTDTSGSVLWSNIIGGAEPDDFHSIHPTSDGGYILAGTTSSFGLPDPNMWLVKTDSLGNQVWAAYPGGDNHDHGYHAIETLDGGFLICGYTSSFGFNGEEAYLVKFGSSGTLPNKLTYITVWDVVSPMCATASAEVRVLLRNFGNEPLSNVSVTVDITGPITQTLNASYAGALVPGDVDTLAFTPFINTSAGGNFTFSCTANVTNDVFPHRNELVKTMNLLPCVGIDELSAGMDVLLYPNPSAGNAALKFQSNYGKTTVEVFNDVGQVIHKESVFASNGTEVRFDVSDSPGIYYIKIKSNSASAVRKLLVY